MPLKVLELFGGIGAPRAALERLGVDFEVVDYVEIDKYAVKSYNAIYDESYEPQDITTWDKNISVDMVMHGSPCQDFSIAGLGKGGEQGSYTRSSLMWHTVRIVEKLKPKVVVWENVLGVLNKNHRKTFDKYIDSLGSMGYTSYFQVLNAKDFGIAQNRKRVFTVSVLGDRPFNFPAPLETSTKISDFVLENPDKRWYLTQKQIEALRSSKYRSRSIRAVKYLHEIAPTLVTMQGGGLEPKVFEPLISDNKDTDTRGIIKLDDKYFNIRKLTPNECWRLMGFSDSQFEKAQDVNSNSQLYKQQGNSIVVDVLYYLFKEMYAQGILK